MVTVAPKEIASQLGISRKTVDAHKGNAKAEFGSRTTPELLRMAIESGIIPKS